MHGCCWAFCYIPAVAWVVDDFETLCCSSSAVPAWRVCEREGESGGERERKGGGGGGREREGEGGVGVRGRREGDKWREREREGGAGRERKRSGGPAIQRCSGFGVPCSHNVRKSSELHLRCSSAAQPPHALMIHALPLDACRWLRLCVHVVMRTHVPIAADVTRLSKSFISNAATLLNADVCTLFLRDGQQFIDAITGKAVPLTGIPGAVMASCSIVNTAQPGLPPDTPNPSPEPLLRAPFWGFHVMRLRWETEADGWILG